MTSPQAGDPHAPGWASGSDAKLARVRSLPDWLTSKILWFGVAAVIVFSAQIAILSVLESSRSAERLARASIAIAPAAARALFDAQTATLDKTLARYVDTYALSGAVVRAGRINVSVAGERGVFEPLSWADQLRFLLPQRFMTASHSVNLMHDGKLIGQLVLTSDNPGFAALICVMLASLVATFFGLVWLATHMARRVRVALRAPVDAITQLSAQVTVAGNFEYRMAHTDSKEAVTFENTVNQFLEVVSGRDKAHQVTTRNLHQELAARAQDIAAQAKQLQTLAYTSTETRLPNRAALVERTHAMCAEPPLTGRSVAIFICHISKLEHANEAFGFDVGALLVQFAADRLEETTPQFSELFHLGGADFAVLVEGDTGAMERVVDQLRFAEESPFLHGGATLHLKLRMGYALFPDDAASAEELMRFAPLAMSEASNSRALGSTVRFKPVFLLNSLARESLEDAIRYALDHDLIEPFFQPRVDVVTGRVSGFEAFVRWKSKDLQGHDNQELIAIAERSMLIVDLDEQMLRRVAAWTGSMAREGIRVPVAVNVSARTLQQPDYVEKFRTTLHAFHVDPSQIELELTETLLIDGDALVAANLRQLEALGVRMLLDDFGSGYSSLRYLHDLPISIVKIDKAFVQGLPGDERSRVIVESTLNLCRRLGKKTVAEGVETEAQFDYLLDIGCNEVQGYYLMRPKSAPQTRDILLKHFNLASGHMVIESATRVALQAMI